MNRLTLENRQIRLWCWIIAILLGLGILFRVVNLDQPVYWVDEVATSMRISGYTQDEVTQQLATGTPLGVSDLLQFQQIRRDRPWTDLHRVLTQSPEHTPLYFVLARCWAETFGGSVTAMRSLSVVFSFLALPAMYGLCQDLFRSSGRQAMRLVSWTAMGLLSISPYFISYAQEARPYSLWILLLLWFNWLLQRSLHTNRKRFWWSYTVFLVLSLYTSLLTVLVVVGQGLAVMLFCPGRRRPYLMATGVALLAFLPWCWVILTQWQVLQDNTTWMRVAMPLWAMLGVWFYGLSVLFFDVPVAAGMPIVMGGQILVSLAAMLLMGYAVVWLLCQTRRSSGALLLMGAAAPPILLLAIDLLRNGQSAATPRYLTPLHLAVLVAVAYLLCDRLLPPSRRWRTITVALLSVCVFSSLIGLTHSSNYQKSRNLSNPAITRLLNQSRSPQVLAEADQIQDLISLSYRLNPDTRFYILPPLSSPAAWLENDLQPDRPTFLFNPSQAMQGAAQSQFGALRQVYQPIKLIQGELGLTLWRIDIQPAERRPAALALSQLDRRECNDECSSTTDL